MAPMARTAVVRDVDRLANTGRGAYYRPVLDEPKLRVGVDLVAGGRRDDAALVDSRDRGSTITYAQLDLLVEQRARELALTRRSLVVLGASNTIDFVVTYLALLRDRHVPLLAGRHHHDLAETWDADTIVLTDGAAITVMHRRPADALAHELHDDLALLLGTSGSTGASKLVRLSPANVLSNAAAIATSLGLTESDRGITSLPMHYCYGLSVLHSHLLAGASVVLIEASVIDPCFGSVLREHGVTNLAGVPHSFELLERADPELVRAPSLRLLTQAGGRLPAERVRAWLDRSTAWGAEFFVMYGQTEATARMAVLPPALASLRPEAVGRAIPGGELSLRPVDGFPTDVGELVYRGPNVMMGYATSTADLALGQTVDELRTGDLGRFHADDGVFEIVGRVSRFVKPLGVRVDLDRIEAVLADLASDVAVGGDDRRLVVVAPGADAVAVRDRIIEVTGLPAALLSVDVDSAIPRTAAGKVDYAAIAATPAEPVDLTAVRSVADVFRAVLGSRHVADDATFVTLGGDSLNYVECSIQLERVLGRLPLDWHVLPVRELEAAVSRPRRSMLDTTVVMRALGVCLIVSTHMKLWWFPGGAHLLIAVVGYNLSRFQLPIDTAADRLRAGLRAAARAALPTMAWVAAGMMLVGEYSAATLSLVNNYAGSGDHENGRWHFWFIEAFVQLTVLTTLLLAIPRVRRLERRAPYLFPLAIFVALLAFRYGWVEVGGMRNLRFKTHGVAWFFALGWLIHQSRTRGQQVLTSLICVATIPGFFDRPEREWFVAGGLVTLLWFKELPVPRLLRRPISLVAAASIWIFISHFRVWPPLDRALPKDIAFALTILAGVVIAWLARNVARSARAAVMRFVPQAIPANGQHPSLASAASGPSIAASLTATAAR